MEREKSPGLADQISPIVQDAGRFVSLHVDLLRSELSQTASAVSPALTSLGTGAGLAAVGGLLGSIALVHGLHRSTRLPLWGCYGVVGGLLGAAGVSLIGSGSRQLSSVSVIPRETLAALQEDLAWVKGKTK